MALRKQSDCLQTLLDILSYEILGQRLSPEMEQLLADHIRQCFDCRTGLHNFSSALHEQDSPVPVQETLELLPVLARMASSHKH